ncbi:MAG: DUF2309 domain-containing protein [Halioglobus sp.]
MTATLPATPTAQSSAAVIAAIDLAINTIAPTWPLDRMIAVNPYWGRIHQSFAEAGTTLAKIAGSALYLPRDWYRSAWQRGEISQTAMAMALREQQSPLTPQQLLEALDDEAAAPVPAPLLSDILDRQRDLRHEPAWCDTITHQVAQFCAAYFDREQADWRPDQSRRLYASWRSALTRDHSVALLMKAPWIAAQAKTLAEEPEQQIEYALNRLGVPENAWPAYLEAVIMRLSGWAAWCAYLRWQARLENSDDHTLVDLLAIRLSWELLLDDGDRGQQSVWHQWQTSWQQHFGNSDTHSQQVQSLWQRAEEISYQNTLVQKLTQAPALNTGETPAVQAVFCIDVRSEVFRRHFEAQSSRIQTLGFAGFFGLPISYAPLGTAATRPQLPGLLAPSIAITDSAGDAAKDQQITGRRTAYLKRLLGWRTFASVPLSTFTMVETLGISYLQKLVRRSIPDTAPLASQDDLGLSQASVTSLRPTLNAQAAGGIDAQARIAAQVLTGMGLASGLAPLVLLLGHGSQTRNNPQRAGLDCGACCGQTGEVNARALAGLLNDTEVRQRLPEYGISVPDETWFLAGLHNTTTDDVQLFDLQSMPAHHADALAEVTAQLGAAGQAARAERAPLLGLAALVDTPTALTRAVRQRANDWAQTRPEWGLANNASFIVAPRSRTRGVNLEGRSFLHDYDYRKDGDGSLLELIMTAPMVVTHWINMQYYASTVDNHRYGSGNKTLHNVTGGRLGLFEGNGGDLRIGLALQSVHNGKQWCHTPLRLTVAIEAPRAAIDAVIAKHPTVKQLVDNQWLYLLRLDGELIESYANGQWQNWPQEQ